MSAPSLFDQPFYSEINEARWRLVARTLADLGSAGVRLTTCLDVGSGPGWFSGRLAALGLRVTGVDGRPENVEEARRRVPGVEFEHADVASDSLVERLRVHDLVFCFGLLYHVEDPFRVLRNLHRLTGRVLFLESVLVPRPEPVVWLVSENTNETQGLTAYALVPTAAALTAMLAASGFRHLYEHADLPSHPDFEETAARHRRRGVYLASDDPLPVAALRPIGPAATPKYDFAKGWRGPWRAEQGGT
jgi:SAM-dependent methyltransferase